MKIKKLVMPMALSIMMGAAAFGAGFAQKEAVEAKADDPVASGIMTFDMVGYWGDEWQCNIAVYFYEGEPGDEPVNYGWSDLVFLATGTQYASVQYSLDFEPTYMIAVRFSNETTEASWDSEVWNQTSDQGYVENANFIITGSEDCSIGRAWLDSSEHSWKPDGMEFTGMKLNGSGYLEYFMNVSMVSGEEFKVVRNSDYLGDNFCDLSSYVNGCFTIGVSDEDDNVICTQDGDYAIFYTPYNGRFYVNTQSAAEADEWAQIFLGVTAGSNNCTHTMQYWASSADLYDALDTDTKNILINTPHMDHEAIATTYIAKAVQRYDYVIERYSSIQYEDFMGRVNSQNLVRPTDNRSLLNNNGATIVIVIGAIALMTTVTALFIMTRKKKQD